MNRRGFIRLLGAAAAVAAIDPERLLWTPGKVTHVLPPPSGWWRNPLAGLFNPPPGLRESFRNADIALHPDAFAFVMEPIDLDVFRRRFTEAVAADALLRIEQAEDLAFMRGDQWPAATQLVRQANGRVTVDVISGVAWLKPEYAGTVKG